MKRFALGLAVLTCVLAGAGWTLYLRDRPEPPPGRSLRFDQLDYDLGPVSPGELLPVHFRVANDSSRPLRAIGMHAACGDNVCFDTTHHDQVPIPARAEAEYVCLVQVNGPGHFECDIEVIFEDHGIRPVTFHVHGTGTGPPP